MSTTAAPETSEQKLQAYIFGGKYGSIKIPTNVDPLEAERFIRQRLDRTKSVDAFERSRRLIDYYDLRSLLEYLQSMLKREEHTSKEFRQSIQLLMILAEVGDVKQRQFANDYFQYLVMHSVATESYAELVAALDDVGGDREIKMLAGRMTASEQHLKSRPSSDEAADDEYQRIDDLINDTLPRVTADKQLRDRVMTIPDPTMRAEQLCRIYMGWGDNDTVELTWWSARELRHESRANSQRTIVDQLRKVLAEIEKSDLPSEEKNAYKLRGVRAIRFFGGELSAEESKLMHEGSGQIDVLDRQQ